jgi:cytochrome P450
MGGFSAGARTCIGKHLVQVEAKIGLIKFMKRYKKITIPNQPLRWVIKFVYSPEYFKSKMTINE